MAQGTHTPWSDELGLVQFDRAQDAEGYVLPNQPEVRTVLCSWENGVSQSEFYSSYKAGLRADAQAAVWNCDYQGERYVTFRGRFYRVIRSIPENIDTRTLILSEVIR